MMERLRQLIRRIPRGKVSTYGAIANAAGHPGGARLVVWALHSAQGLPWHRVLGAGGEIRLPGEEGLEQRLRLESEGVTFEGRKVRMDRHEFQFSTRAKAKKKTPPKPAKDAGRAGGSGHMK